MSHLYVMKTTMSLELFFFKHRSYYSIMDIRFQNIIQHIHEKNYVTLLPTSSAINNYYTYNQAKDVLTTYGHPPSAYRDDDNQHYYIARHWTTYMMEYVFYISMWVQRACYMSDIEIAVSDRLYAGEGVFQSDHINSVTNYQLYYS